MHIASDKKQKFNKFTIIFIILFFIAGFTIALINNKAKRKPDVKAVRGEINLSNWNFSKDGIANLDGEWNFSWKKQLMFNDIKEKDNQLNDFSILPNIWLRDKINKKDVSMFGYATYYLKVKTNGKDKILSLKLPEIQTSYKLYINDSLVSESGIAGKDKASSKAELKPGAVYFVPPSEDFYIIIHVSNYYGSLGGIWNSIQIGNQTDISNAWGYNVRKDLFLIGTMLIMAVYYLSIFLLRNKERAALYFSIICMIIAIRLSILDSYFIYSIIPKATYGFITFFNFLTIYWGPVVFAFFISELFPLDYSKVVKKLLLIIASIETIMTIFMPVYMYTRLTLIYDGIAIIIVIICILSTIKAMKCGKEDAEIVLVSSIIIVFALLYDTLFESHYINGIIEVTPFAFFICIFLQAFILAKRFSKDYLNSKNLTIKLNDMLENEKILTEKLTKADKIKDEFLANTSHELRTPLNGMINISEAILQESLGPVNEMQKKNLSLVVSNGKRLTALINDILDISKLKNNDIKLDIKSMNIGNCINSVINVLKFSNVNESVKIKVNCSLNIPLVLADENRVKQILFNLVGNSVKFTNNGYISVFAEEIDDFVKVIVEDTGKGIPQDKIDLIWNAFEQIDSSITQSYGGVGLGLSITKHLVELQGGVIHAESELGKGSKFIFTLPISKGVQEKQLSLCEAPNSKPHNKLTLPDKINQKGPKILVVDDDIVNLYSIANILKLDGYNIISENSAIKALERIRQEGNYSLVILDVMMPEISGYDICRKIREIYTMFELPVLMLTANNQPNAVVLSFKEGANDFLTKPFETTELLARVRTLIELKNSVSKAMDMEMAFLQAQIKPHFLFNVLNTIAALCDKNSEEASELIIELSKYLRCSFDFSNVENFIPLRKEIEYVNSYLTLEKARFGDKLNVELEINIETEIMIPPLIIQPIVENSVKHGLRGKRQGGTVRIIIENKENVTVIKVWDNGKGMTEEKISSLLISDTERKSVGLRNIDLRLKRLYGRGIEIKSEEDVGTQVQIFIPLWKGEENNC